MGKLHDLVARADTCRLAIEALRADRPLKQSEHYVKRWQVVDRGLQKVEVKSKIGYTKSEIEAWQANKSERLDAILYVLQNGEPAPHTKAENGAVTWELP
jgi:hypothetical protein